MFLNFTGLIYALIGKFIGKFSIVLGAIATFFCIRPYNDIGLIYTFIIELLTNDGAMIMYLVFTLTIGFMIISQAQFMMPNFMIRKTFHILAFFLFVPAIIYAKFDKPRFIILAFNVVSVVLIIVEVLRHNKCLPQ